jgi:predicted HAD superfamily Cof-like phosphohydrolase
MTKGLDLIVELVGQFHSAFGHPVADEVKPLALERGTNRAVWTGEEALVEFIHQSSDNEEQFLAAYDKLIAGLEKAKAKSLAMEYPKNETEKVVGQADALVDACYFIGGSFVEIGIKPQPLFDIVQAANMAKLGPDGKPIIRPEDGKIMKPEGWEPPETKLEAEIKRQMTDGNA